MKTLRLDIDYEYDFDLYGVVSPVKDYKLAWALNNIFDLRLSRQNDLCYDLFGKDRLIISNYQYITDHSMVRLFRNRALVATTLKKPFLLPDIKEYDYVIQISGAMQQLYPQEFINSILKTQLVQYVKKFDPLTLKFKENLLF
ncbi:IPExxxVDY family protein [Pontibacter cellulosilyticus]|uniref:IPExxxVDY family protein n=1 Tax=Pontibacter cellulosilyticus TaxID=1720253 RepID=A0A923N8D3_9BACT|nr:IPExxxVDY family protein [Pontibacter cellulosilyticus]MBC5993286.1 IPExxxVDY family protein [Pontibacter cellulosilyticus]